MEQLIELLQQIQDLAGAGIDALKGATEKGGQDHQSGGGAPAEGAAPPAGPDKGAPPAA